MRFLPEQISEPRTVIVFQEMQCVMAEINVGIPMTRPGDVSPPPSRSAYMLDDKTMKKEIWCPGGVQHENGGAGRKRRFQLTPAVATK